MREVVYLGNKHRRRFLKIRIELLRTAQALQFLHRQFHRRERVVDLVRHLPCHGPPGSFTLGGSQLFSRLLHPVHEDVIALDECSQFIVIRIIDVVILGADSEMAHLVRQGRKRCSHTFGSPEREEQRQQQHDDVRRQQTRQ